ncbi:MAG TPA: menaquinone reductase multiheme cytochrome c subunit QrcA [Candidatus Polarisedimenticolia bacterium]|nr:menaquinone reductase multiheme cytochrome c subunit QrcA [Candidatus Polarisedimenticolia bacterium]
MNRWRDRLFVMGGLATSLLAGWILFPWLLYQRIEQPLNFSHRAHAGDGVGLACEDCHPLATDGRHGGIPALQKCVECHQEVIGESPHEARLVEDYVRGDRPIPWQVYWRQPDNVHFSHAAHVRLAELACEECHGDHGLSDRLPPYERNRISGYSRNIWGSSLARIGTGRGDGMKMNDCTGCHRRLGVVDGCLDCHK